MKRGIVYKETQENFSGERNAYYLDWGYDFTNVYLYQSGQIVHLKYVHLVCFNYISISHINKRTQLSKWMQNKAREMEEH